MLESLRKSGASIFIYLIFGLLIVIFVINFAPSKRQGEGGGCTGASNTVLTVDGSKVNQTAYHVAYSANGYSGREKVYVALEMLIRRELLAQAAAERGLRVTNDVIEDQMKKGYFFLGGFRLHDAAFVTGEDRDPEFIVRHNFFDDVDGEKFFNIRKFKGWVNSLNISVGSYYDEQARSMQAALMSDLMQDSVRVSRDEALSDFLFQKSTVNYDVVTWNPTAYREAMRLTDADIQRFLAGHEDDVKAKYKLDERSYKGTKPALKLRSILIAKAEPAADKKADDKKTDDKKTDDKKTDAGAAKDKPAADDKAGASKAAPPVDAKKADDKKADAKTADDKKLAEKPADKKADDKKLAEKPDAKTADAKTADAKAGDAKSAGAAGAAAKPIGLPIEEAKAKLEAARTAIAAGKLKFADAAKQLATDDAAKANGGDVGWKTSDNPGLGDKAVNDAIKALKPGDVTPVIVTDKGAYLVTAEDKREGDLSYDQVKNEIAAEMARDVWSKEAAKRAALDGMKAATTAKLLDDVFDRSVDKDEEKRRMEMMLQEQMKKQGLSPGPEHGSLEIESKDIPAAWYATDNGGGAGAGSAPAAAGSGAGSASAAGAPAAPAPVTPTVDPLAPSKDVLPSFGDMPKAKVILHGPWPRRKEMPGIGSSKEAITALFDELGDKQLVKHPYESDGTYVIFSVASKGQPKVEEFDKVAEDQLATLRFVRGRALVEDYLKTKCLALAKDNRIKPSAEKIEERDDKGNPLPPVYRPCMSFR